MCSCGEAPTLFSAKLQKARKNHTCCECHSVISSGELYELSKGLWEGEFSQYKTCSICKNVREEAISDGGLDCICFTELWDTVGVEYEGAAV